MRRNAWGLTALGLVLTFALTACNSLSSPAPGGSNATSVTTTKQTGASATDASANGTGTGSAAAQPAATATFTYRNDRFHFAASLPKSFTQFGAAPTDGGGLKFSADGGSVVVAVWGANNAVPDTPTSAAAMEISSHQGGRVTLDNVSGNSFTVSGYDKSGIEIWYTHEIVESQAEYGISWTYPASAAGQVSPELTASVKSFVPGPNQAG